MDDKEAKSIFGSYATPLVISAAGIICSTLAIAAYHFFLSRFFFRPQRVQGRNNRRRIKKNGGVDEEILDKIPVLQYSIQNNEAFRLDHNECFICLGELEDGELVRLLPSCNHAFHVPCIDAWFMNHANCPVCRSQITCDCDCESTMPTTNSKNGREQTVSHVPPRIFPSDEHHRIMNDDVSANCSSSISTSTSRFQRQHPLLLHHSLSFSSRIQEKPRAVDMWLKRSLSLNQSSLYIAIPIQRDQEKASTSSCSSSSTKGVVMSPYNYKLRSFRHIDHMSSVLMRSFSRFRQSRSGRYSGILPS